MPLPLTLEDIDEDDDENVAPIKEYELTSSPNDFNVFTLNDFTTRGYLKIPSFQRNYVWDLKDASKLMESIMLGLPIPQIFLYEEANNSYLVIDGQQRLLSIYYFMRGRFPKQDARPALRRKFDEHNGDIPESILQNDGLFQVFKLRLAKGSPFNGLKYDTLEEYRAPFDMRTIRCVVVRQTKPEDDKSSVFEIFHRLNTGGMKLTNQEIRTSLFHSDFYDMLARLNLNQEWRRILGASEPDLHMRDTEVLLRAFAMLIDGRDYSSSSMIAFLEKFSKNAKKLSKARVDELHATATAFFATTTQLPPDAFHGVSGKFSVTIFESAFATICAAHPQIDARQTLAIPTLKVDTEFRKFATARSSNRVNVEGRLGRAQALLAVKGG